MTKGRRRKTPKELERIKKSIEKSKKKDKKNCLKGEHGIYLYPLFHNREWDKKSIYCRNCKVELTIKELSAFWKRWVRDCAIIYKEMLSKLPPIRQFNKDGY